MTFKEAEKARKLERLRKKLKDRPTEIPAVVRVTSHGRHIRDFPVTLLRKYEHRVYISSAEAGAILNDYASAILSGAPALEIEIIVR